MANTVTSPNMNLPVPVVGVDPGPQYGLDINACLAIIDQHNHAPGAGVPITPSGLSITSDLTMMGNNLTTIRSLRFTPQGSPLSLPADIGCLYESGIDLYYNDGAGTVIRITQNSGVAGTPGSISGLLPPASASYVGASSTFIWQSDVNTSADMDFGSAILRNPVANSFGLTLAPPTAMGSNTTITLPTLPASNSVVIMDSSGNQTASVAAFQSLVPPGVILPFGGTSTPAGFLFCDGTAVSRTTYSSLFAAIGIAYGNGDGSTTFNVPDFRGTFMRGTDNGRGIDPDASSRPESGAGGNAGDNVGSFEFFATQSHTHQVSNPPGVFWFQGIGPLAAAGASGGSASATATTTAQNGNVSAETRPTNIYVNYIIKT